MPGWLDWFEDEITCSKCGFKFLATFCEDGDTSTIPPIVKCFIADEITICPNCGVKMISDNLIIDDLK